jgi:hypothetical protein
MIKSTAWSVRSKNLASVSLSLLQVARQLPPIARQHRCQRGFEPQMPQRPRERPAAAEAEHRAARHFDATRDQPGQDARQAEHAAEQDQLVRPRDRSAADGMS